MVYGAGMVIHFAARVEVGEEPRTRFLILCERGGSAAVVQRYSYRLMNAQSISKTNTGRAGGFL